MKHVEQNLTALSYRLRQHVVDIIMAGKGGHIGGDMSVIDTLVTLYFDQMNISPENDEQSDRDLFVLARDTAWRRIMPSWLHKGFFPYEEVLAEFCELTINLLAIPTTSCRALR